MQRHYMNLNKTFFFLLFGIFLIACQDIPNSTNTPTTTATIITLESQNRVPTSISAKNGWTPKYIATLHILPLNQYTQEEIANLLFTQWLNHFKTEDADSRNRLDEYQILKVEVPENLAYLAQEQSVEYVATVVFSVKPTVYMYSSWNAGNGISDDNIWIRQKFVIIGIEQQKDVYSLRIIGTGP